MTCVADRVAIEEGPSSEIEPNGRACDRELANGHVRQPSPLDPPEHRLAHPDRGRGRSDADPRAASTQPNLGACCGLDSRRLRNPAIESALACRHDSDDAGADLLAAHLRQSGVGRPNGRRKAPSPQLWAGFERPEPETVIGRIVLLRFGRGAPVRARRSRSMLAPARREQHPGPPGCRAGSSHEATHGESPALSDSPRCQRPGE